MSEIVFDETKIHVPEDFTDANDTLTFVTVVFSGEFANLLLQARSLSLYGNDAIKKWIIILNDEIEISEKNKIFISLRDELIGAHFEVVWIDRREMTDYDFSEIPGSRSQQIIKILVSNIIDDKLYVLLDAKNHAIRELKPDFFVRDDRPIVHKQEYEDWNPFTRWFFNAFNLLGLPPEKSLYEKYQSTTPYVMETDIAKKCMDKSIINSDKNWDYFISLGWDDIYSTTEFALYGAVFEFYKRESIFSEKNYVTLFDGYPNGQSEVMRFIGEIKNDKTKFFSVHRNRAPTLNMEESKYLAECWVSCGLFSCVESGIFFLRNGLMDDYKLST
ncbi:DUF6492 family protein [Brytella acorum]|uniref:DUF6492 family protein n=1 Tax=Brytella acorum TaxID=2959299 RepID=A0AA35UJ05_9PROT|nr:DUF6492 family protein [Brytella acorum]CAI9122431.1 DUF6492 family protein [Brytella acorum]